jgi:hypothetical protein
MRRLASLVAIVLLFFAVSPALACVANRAMSHEESACCRMLHSSCGQMVKQGCCRMELRTSERPQLLAAAPETNVHWAVVARLGSISAADRPNSLLLLPSAMDHAPPGSLAVTIAVLRI